MSIVRTTQAVRFRTSLHRYGFVLAAFGLLALCGCSSSAPIEQIQVGTIAFTDANAATQKSLTLLTVGQGTYLDVTLSNDKKLLGVDWSVVCGSALPPGTPLPPGQTQDQSCGTFVPGHTLSGPLPSYATSGGGYVTFYVAPAVPPKQGIVTLYASATSDPSRFSTVTLSIGGLPISVGFAPAPPASLGLSTSTQFKAVLNNDATGAGVNWSVLCGSSACGSFSPSQTANGTLTTYTSPASVPSGGTVKVTATSVADPTKSVSASIQIVPISVGINPTVLPVATAGTGQMIATVSNDGANKGVDWSVNCTNTVTPGSCGMVTAHTASGAAATYTAPGLANIAVGSTINVTATSTTDPSKSATSVITTTKGNLVSGTSQAAQRPVRNALVTLYAATTGDTPQGASAQVDDVSSRTAVTDDEGNFTIPYGYRCQAPNAQMYLVSRGGNAGGGINPNLVLMSALGPCAKLDASRFIVNEATTVAAVYALSSFMTDAEHVGSASASPSGVAAAFATAHDLVDVTTGLVLARTVSGSGITPQTKIDSLANAVGACASTSGPTLADGSPCDQLFRATNPGPTPASQANDTSQALLDLAQHATGFGGGSGLVTAVFALGATAPYFSHALSLAPRDWTLSVQFPKELQPVSGGVGTEPFVDSAGNVWIRGSGLGIAEFVGAKPYAEQVNALILGPLNAGSEP